MMWSAPGTRPISRGNVTHVEDYNIFKVVLQSMDLTTTPQLESHCGSCVKGSENDEKKTREKA